MKKILLAGCGGGYDVFGVIPLYLKFKNDNTIFISSLSFTSMDTLTACDCVSKINDNLYVVDANLNKIYQDFIYFPEYYLSRELNVNVYIIIVDSTIDQIRNAYMSISSEFDEIYLVDAGCDSLLSGKESELASYVEDMMNLKAIETISCPHKYVCAIGLNCDCGHGVVEVELIDRLAYLRDTNIIVGQRAWSLNDLDIKMYVEICSKSNLTNTIVHSLVIARLYGKAGYYTPDHLTYRLTNNKVNLSDLTTLFITCDYDRLQKTIIYFDGLAGSFDRDQTDDYVTEFVSKLDGNCSRE